MQRSAILRVGEELSHLFFRLDIVLPAFIAHAVLIGHLLAGLEAEQKVMSLGIFGEGIVDIVGTDQRDPGLL